MSSSDSQPLEWATQRLRWKLGRMAAFLFRFSEIRLLDFVFKNISSPCRTMRSFYEYQLHIDLARSMAQKLLYLQGPRFITELSLFKQHVRPGMTIVDVGANIGYHVLMFEHLLRGNGKIVAIEPSPENLVELHANVEGNHLKNVDVHPVAIGARIANVGVKSGINGGILESPDIADVGIRLVPMSDLISERVDFIKIDVDGYEGEVLKGAVDVLRNHQPTLLIELHPHLIGRFGSSLKSIFQLLREHYNHFEAYDQFRQEDMSMLTRIASRYRGSYKLKTIDDLDKVIELGDANQHGWTFWVIARKV